MTEGPIINQEKCNGCGLCVSVCTCGALSLAGGVVVINRDLVCSWCTVCEAVCPSGAIACPFEIVVEEN